jgi:hypothetical protein
MKLQLISSTLIILIFTICSLACTEQTEKAIRIDEDNTIWVGERMQIHFKNGKVDYETIAGFSSYEMTDEKIIIQNEHTLFDTLQYQLENPNMLKVIVIASGTFAKNDTLYLDKFVQKDSLKLTYYESTPCFGNCPIQRITVIQDTLRWYGESFLEKTGYLEIPISNIEQIYSTISKRLEVSNISNYQNYDFNPGVDNPTYTIGYSKNGVEVKFKLAYETSKEIRYLTNYLEGIYLEL